MRPNPLSLAFAAAILLTLAGCADDGAGEAADPGFELPDGKADDLASVRPEGTLELGAVSKVTGIRAGQAVGYFIDVGVETDLVLRAQLWNKDGDPATGTLSAYGPVLLQHTGPSVAKAPMGADGIASTEVTLGSGVYFLAVKADEAGIFTLGTECAKSFQCSAVNDLLPPLLELQSVWAGFTVKADVEIFSSFKANAWTTHETLFTLSLTDERFEFGFSPPLWMDAQWPADNVDVASVGWDFGTATPMVDARNAGFGLWDVTDTVVETLSRLLRGWMLDTAMEQPGYSPFADPLPLVTLSEVANNVINTPAETTPQIGQSDLLSPSLGARVRLTERFEQSEGSSAVVLEADTAMSLTVVLKGNVADIVGDEDFATAAQRTRVKRINITSDGIVLFKKDKPMVRILSAAILPGGVVELGEAETLIGAVETLKGVESVARLVRVLVLASRGVRANDNGDPTTTESAVRAEIETALTKAVVDTVKKNRDVIKGVDLATALGIQ